MRGNPSSHCGLVSIWRVPPSWRTLYVGSVGGFVIFVSLWKRSRRGWTSSQFPTVPREFCEEEDMVSMAEQFPVLSKREFL